MTRECSNLYAIRASMEVGVRSSLKPAPADSKTRLHSAAPVTRCLGSAGGGELGNTAILYQTRANIGSLCARLFIFRPFFYAFSHFPSQNQCHKASKRAHRCQETRTLVWDDLLTYLSAKGCQNVLQSALSGQSTNPLVCLARSAVCVRQPAAFELVPFQLFASHECDRRSRTGS